VVARDEPGGSAGACGATRINHDSDHGQHDQQESGRNRDQGQSAQRLLDHADDRVADAAVDTVDTAESTSCDVVAWRRRPESVRRPTHRHPRGDCDGGGEDGAANGRMKVREIADVVEPGILSRPLERQSTGYEQTRRRRDEVNGDARTTVEVKRSARPSMRNGASFGPAGRASSERAEALARARVEYSPVHEGTRRFDA